MGPSRAANGEPPAVVRLLQQAPPSAAKQWAVKHDAQIEVSRPKAVTASGGQPRPAGGMAVRSWLTPQLIDQIRAAVVTQGWSLTNGTC